MTNEEKLYKQYKDTVDKFNELAMKYEELSSKYVEEKKKNQEIVELLEKEQTLNDELIAEMKKVSENTTTISNNYMKLFKDYSELLPLKKNGIVVEWDNDESTRKFIPILGSLDEIEYGNVKLVNGDDIFKKISQRLRA